MKHLIRFDWAVKRLLRNKANFGILEGFLSELLHEDIKIKQILESEGNRQTSDDKTNRVDLLVQNSKEELIIIEVQNNYMTDYLQRMHYGTSKIITDNMIIGMPYAKVKKVISVNIVYFDLGHGEDYVYHGTTNFVGIHKKDVLQLSATEERIYHTLEIAKVYPEYYIIKVDQFNQVATNTLDEWINFFKNQEVKDGTTAKGLKEANDELNIMKLSQEERWEYEGYIKDWRDNYGEVVGNYNKGKFERDVEIVNNMINMGLAIPIIIQATGLKEEEIKKMIKN